MKPKYTILIIIAISFFTCKNEEGANLSHSKTVLKIAKYDTLLISSNNNDKWISNIETHEGLLNLDSIISNFKSGDYQSLSKNLSQQTSYIIENCTMKGEPHDQLHVVLVPILNEISELKETTDIEKGRVIISNLKTLIRLYFQHFKS